LILATYSQFVGCFGHGNPPDNSGHPKWPVSGVIYEGEPGFHLAMPTQPTLVANIYANSGVFDAVNGVDEFDWYLSQRTDDLSLQMIAISRLNEDVATRSGGVAVGPSARAFSTYGPSVVWPTPEQALKIFRDVWIYVRRRSNGHIMRGGFLTGVSQNV
jgi:hypothetical protein